ncbi:MAG: zinc-ribbon domain-containing protein [Lachnospiraceae bacterium]
MFCTKCGKEIPEGNQYCTACGAPLEPDTSEKTYVSVNNNKNNTDEKPQSKKKRNIIGICAAVVLLVILVALFSGDSAVDTVKGGKFNAYPENTVGKAFENFFSDPEWTSYEENGHDYVKFTGGCTLYGEPVNAKIIFVVDGKAFNIKSMRVGNLDLTNVYDQEILLDKIFAE